MLERNVEFDQRSQELKGTLKTILSVQFWRFPASREISSREVHGRLINFFSDQLKEMGLREEADRIIQESTDNPTYIPFTERERMEFKK